MIDDTKAATIVLLCDTPERKNPKRGRKSRDGGGGGGGGSAEGGAAGDVNEKEEYPIFWPEDDCSFHSPEEKTGNLERAGSPASATHPRSSRRSQPTTSFGCMQLDECEVEITEATTTRTLTLRKRRRQVGNIRSIDAAARQLLINWVPAEIAPADGEKND